MQRRSHAQRAVAAQSLATDEQSSRPSLVTLVDELTSLSCEVEIPSVGKVVCRAMGGEDGVGACVVLTRAFAGSPEEIGITDATKYVDKMRENVPRGILYIAALYPSDPALRPPNRDCRVIGTVALSLHQDTLQQIPTLPPPPHSAYLSNMAVDQKFRRMGVAKALLALCDQAVAVAGLSDVYLHVRQGDAPAATLYGAAGYAEVARDSFLSAQLKKVRPRVLMRKSVSLLYAQGSADNC
eukprot:CAMPEP_0202858056 /NCGR_PEP_ID=MMETSP1391-20130828/746_1 /ASSEMBLY_ACC=CAM_ASM_000867 /TAXON_ID=1034604 /ORGANISM="Chlamydomonas leiostraca, Strain SAG 11-49" /LENGTH=239 /DNA_ID=CAMNT_0049536927 /DNA_START=230 /DNA_END=949 /DNA_ORIENTATION=-